MHEPVPRATCLFQDRWKEAQTLKISHVKISLISNCDSYEIAQSERAVQLAWAETAPGLFVWRIRHGFRDSLLIPRSVACSALLFFGRFPALAHLFNYLANF
jgi:hypothetical protein